MPKLPINGRTLLAGILILTTFVGAAMEMIFEKEEDVSGEVKRPQIRRSMELPLVKPTNAPAPHLTIKKIVNDSKQLLRIGEQKNIWHEGAKVLIPQMLYFYIEPGKSVEDIYLYANQNTRDLLTIEAIMSDQFQAFPYESPSFQLIATVTPTVQPETVLLRIKPDLTFEKIIPGQMRRQRASMPATKLVAQYNPRIAPEMKIIKEIGNFTQYPIDIFIGENREAIRIGANTVFRDNISLEKDKDDLWPKIIVKQRGNKLGETYSPVGDDDIYISIMQQGNKLILSTSPFELMKPQHSFLEKTAEKARRLFRRK